MINVKNTQRSLVAMTFDGRVIKKYSGPYASERFHNEVRVLLHLEQRGCPFVPRLLSHCPEELRIEMTSCGTSVQRLSEDRCALLFDELQQYGVIHEDRHPRNVTYRAEDGRFCLIDFEYSRIDETVSRVEENLEWLSQLVAGELQQEC